MTHLYRDFEIDTVEKTISKFIRSYGQLLPTREN